MMLEPSSVVLYVENIAQASQFYQDLLEIKPEEASQTFHTFTLSNGMSFGLKANHAVEPPIDNKNGGGELAFTLDNNKKVDALFAEWQEKGINMALPPTVVLYGYTFVALDPDGHRLRVVSLSNS